jgi:hypothetical protein
MYAPPGIFFGLVLPSFFALWGIVLICNGNMKHSSKQRCQVFLFKYFCRFKRRTVSCCVLWNLIFFIVALSLILGRAVLVVDAYWLLLPIPLSNALVVALLTLLLKRRNERKVMKAMMKVKEIHDGRKHRNHGGRDDENDSVDLERQSSEGTGDGTGSTDGAVARTLITSVGFWWPERHLQKGKYTGLRKNKKGREKDDGADGSGVSEEEEDGENGRGEGDYMDTQRSKLGSRAGRGEGGSLKGRTNEGGSLKGRTKLSVRSKSRRAVESAREQQRETAIEVAKQKHERKRNSKRGKGSRKRSLGIFQVQVLKVPRESLPDVVALEVTRYGLHVTNHRTSVTLAFWPWTVPRLDSRRASTALFGQHMARAAELTADGVVTRETKANIPGIHRLPRVQSWMECADKERTDCDIIMVSNVQLLLVYHVDVPLCAIASGGGTAAWGGHEAGRHISLPMPPRSFRYVHISSLQPSHQILTQGSLLYIMLQAQGTCSKISRSNTRIRFPR